MKRIVLSVCLILGMTVPMATPAHAIFGLSACEKVKKQVLDYESQINGIAKYWFSFKGKNIPSSLVPKFSKQVFGSNDLVQQLTKLAYNNPKCFTRTQNEEIKGRKDANWNITQFVGYQRKYILRESKTCQEIWQQFEPTKECLIRTEIKISNGYTIPTLYSF
jgi:hypothetical protein